MQQWWQCRWQLASSPSMPDLLCPQSQRCDAKFLKNILATTGFGALCSRASLTVKFLRHEIEKRLRAV